VDIKQRLAKNLRKARTGKGWSQEELAFEAGIHRTYISDLERASRNPTIGLVEKLAEALETSAGGLLD